MGDIPTGQNSSTNNNDNNNNNNNNDILTGRLNPVYCPHKTAVMKASMLPKGKGASEPRSLQCLKKRNV